MAEHGDFESEVALIMGKKVCRIVPGTSDITVKVQPSFDPDADMKPEIEGVVIDLNRLNENIPFP